MVFWIFVKNPSQTPLRTFFLSNLRKLNSLNFLFIEPNRSLSRGISYFMIPKLSMIYHVWPTRKWYSSKTNENRKCMQEAKSNHFLKTVRKGKWIIKVGRDLERRKKFKERRKRLRKTKPPTKHGKKQEKFNDINRLSFNGDQVLLCGCQSSSLLIATKRNAA